MDLNVGLAQSQRVLKQRNMLAIAAMALFGLVVVLMLVSASSEREIVLQPILRTPLTVSSGGVSEDYLEMVTRDTALLAPQPQPREPAILAGVDPRHRLPAIPGAPSTAT